MEEGKSNNNLLNSIVPKVIVDDTEVTPTPVKNNNLNMNIDDYNSMSYFTEFNMGSEKHGVRLAFDTASPVSIINSQNCEGCD